MKERLKSNLIDKLGSDLKYVYCKDIYDRHILPHFRSVNELMKMHDWEKCCSAIRSST